MTEHFISLQHIYYRYADQQSDVFADLSLSFSQKAYGIVGKNGAGKTTLLKLISGELKPQSGSVQRQGKIAYLPQVESLPVAMSVSDYLGLSEKLAALKRIEQGSIDGYDYDCVGDDWNLQEKVDTLFHRFLLPSLTLGDPLENLSGGELTRLKLVKILLSDADFLLLDEPTNNLDRASKQRLCEVFSEAPQILLIVSHDRELLRNMDMIIDCTPQGIRQYGGNYDDYLQEKTQQEDALRARFQSEQQQLQQKKQQVQTRLERHQQNAAKGRQGKQAQIKAKGSYDKIAFNSAKGRSEKSLRTITKQAERQLTIIDERTTRARSAFVDEAILHFSLPDPKLSGSQNLLTLDNLSFGFQNNTPLFNNLSLQINGPERVALSGANGTGKSSLLKLILGELKADTGTIQINREYIAYLDQHYSGLEDNLSLIDNYCQFNRSHDVTTAHHHLAQFKFRAKDGEKLASSLSGGERLRALLACTLMKTPAPKLLILDEPTNHLDITSIRYLERVLITYKGAILLVSHDGEFLQNIGTTKEINIEAYR